MTDPYSILGVSRSSSEDEIKAAYRKLAMEHHPDRNQGNPESENRFKEISAAYDQIKNGTAQSQSNPHDPFGGFNFSFGFNGHPMEEILRNFANQAQHAAQQRNRDYNAVCQITLQQAFTGCEALIKILDSEYRVRIPAGADNGLKVRLAGAGDSSIPNIPPGDLYVNIQVHHTDNQFNRDGKHLISEITVDSIDAILGGKIIVNTIDGEQVEINLPPGVQYGYRHCIEGKGMPVIGKSERGNLYLVTIIKTSQDLTDKQIALLNEVRALKT